MSGTYVKDLEHTLVIKSSEWRKSHNLASSAAVTTLKDFYTSIVLKSVEFEVSQVSLLGTEEGNIKSGTAYYALIPSKKDTDEGSGKDRATVQKVMNKHMFPLSREEQGVRNGTFKIEGYELDLALDARRGAHPVLWLGNTTSASRGQDPEVIAITIRFQVECSGVSPLW